MQSGEQHHEQVSRKKPKDKSIDTRAYGKRWMSRKKKKRNENITSHMHPWMKNQKKNIITVGLRRSSFTHPLGSAARTGAPAS